MKKVIALFLLLSSGVIDSGQNAMFFGGNKASGGGGGTPTFVSNVGGGFAFATSSPDCDTTNTGVQCILGGTIVVGQTAIFSVMGSQGSAGVLTAVSDTHNTYTAVTAAQSALLNTVSVGSAATVAGTGVTNITGTAGNSFWFTQVMLWSGVSTISIDGTASADTNASGTVSCGTITPMSGEKMIIVAVLSNGGNMISVSAGSGYTIPANGSYTAGTNFSAGAVEYQYISSTSGSYSPTFTIGNPGTVNTCVTIGYRVT